MARFPALMASLAMTVRCCPLLASCVNGGRRRSRRTAIEGDPGSTPTYEITLSGRVIIVARHRRHRARLEKPRRRGSRIRRHHNWLQPVGQECGSPYTQWRAQSQSGASGRHAARDRDNRTLVHATRSAPGALRYLRATTIWRKPMTQNVAPRDFVADHTVERSQRPMIGGPNKFKVAIFGANVTTGQGGLNLAENTIKLGNWGEIKVSRRRPTATVSTGSSPSPAGKVSRAPTARGAGSSRRSRGPQVWQQPRRTYRSSPPASSPSSTR